MNHRLRFGSGELVITTQRLMARFPDETAWNAWELAPDLALSHHDHAGVGTLELRDATGFTVAFSQMEPGGMRILDMVRSEQPVVIVTRPGALLDFHASAQGKIALAFGDARLGEAPLRQWTTETLTDPVALAEEVEAARKRGWAEAPNQTLAGVTAVAAPVFDMTAGFVATLTISGPTNTIGSPPDPTYVEAVSAAARKISKNLGNTDQVT